MLISSLFYILNWLFLQPNSLVLGRVWIGRHFRLFIFLPLLVRILAIISFLRSFLLLSCCNYLRNLDVLSWGLQQGIKISLLFLCVCLACYEWFAFAFRSWAQHSSSIHLKVLARARFMLLGYDTYLTLEDFWWVFLVFVLVILLLYYSRTWHDWRFCSFGRYSG